MKTKIAHFMTYTADGGVESLVRDYALLTNKEQFDVVVIVMQRIKGAAMDRILAENGIKMISLYNSLYTNNSIIAKLCRKINNIWYIPYKTKKIIKTECIDVLHIHIGILHHIRRISSFLKSKKIIFTCHSVPESIFTRAEKNAAKFLIENNCLQVIALHDEMRKEINSLLGISNTRIIKNGIDFNRFLKTDYIAEDYRKQINIPIDSFVIGNIGRFVDSKNHFFLIDLFSECYKRNNKSFLLLIGDGDNKSIILERLNNYGLDGHYMIFSNRNDIPQLLNCMDVFVFPSKYEGFGIVAIEAQVAGLRCVISDAVPREVFQTDLAIPMSLNDPLERWCDAIFNSSMIGHGLGHIEDYNMRSEVKKLEKLYE